ncbi:hypothetical protein HDV03_002432 [Kappamyces sp. JEL0829]|nr:hypothetical protein HDV03_002432 [Kappamyces sp. JEL0829]
MTPQKTVEPSTIPWKRSQIVRIDDDVSDLVLQNLDGCIVLFSRHLTSLFLKNIKNCIVGPVSVQTSALVQDIENSVLGLQCRQLRCHNSKDVHLCVVTSSNPIIEDCTKMVFSRLADPPTAAEPTANAFTSVEDFNWHKQAASPNFCILPEPQDAFDFTQINGDISIHSIGQLLPLGECLE